MLPQFDFKLLLSDKKSSKHYAQNPLQASAKAKVGIISQYP